MGWVRAQYDGEEKIAGGGAGGATVVAGTVDGQTVYWSVANNQYEPALPYWTETGSTITPTNMINVILPDDAATPPLNITPRSAAPTTPSANDVYLDDGTNTVSGQPQYRQWIGPPTSAWVDIGASGAIPPGTIQGEMLYWDTGGNWLRTDTRLNWDNANDDLTLASSQSTHPVFTIESTFDDQNAATIKLIKDRATPAAGDAVGVLEFETDSSVGTSFTAGRLTVSSPDVINSDGRLLLEASEAGTLRSVFDANVDTITLGNSSIANNYLWNKARIQYSDSIYTDISTDLNGDFYIRPTGANIGIGYRSLFLSTGTGIGVGYLSMYRNSGTDCYGYGTASLYNNAGNQCNGFGLYSLYMNIGDRCCGMGQYNLRYNVGDDVNVVGFSAGFNNIGNSFAGIGNNAGYNNEGGNNSAIGSGALPFLPNTSGEKTFDYTDINASTNRITINSHNFGSIGTWTNLKFTEGTSGIGGFVNTTVYQAKIIDNDTLGFQEADGPGGSNRGVNITDAGTGTGHKFTPQYKYENVTCLGANSIPTASNQVVLGDDNVTHMRGPKTTIRSGANSDHHYESLVDEATYDLPDATSGIGLIKLGTEYTQISWEADGSIMLLISSDNVINSDTDGYLCVFDNGTTVRIKNRLGSTKDLLVNVTYI
jgi:hypothetical protein